MRKNFYNQQHVTLYNYHFCEFLRRVTHLNFTTPCGGGVQYSTIKKENL